MDKIEQAKAEAISDANASFEKHRAAIEEAFCMIAPHPAERRMFAACFPLEAQDLQKEPV